MTSTATLPPDHGQHMTALPIGCGDQAAPWLPGWVTPHAPPLVAPPGSSAAQSRLPWALLWPRLGAEFADSIISSFVCLFLRCIAMLSRLISNLRDLTSVAGPQACTTMSRLNCVSWSLTSAKPCSLRGPASFTAHHCLLL
jgi:hypothetical protein